MRCNLEFSWCFSTAYVHGKKGGQMRVSSLQTWMRFMAQQLLSPSYPNDCDFTY